MAAEKTPSLQDAFLNNVRKNKIPLTIFLVFISPWLVDPLFHKFTPLQDSHPALVASIEKLTQRAGMPIPCDGCRPYFSPPS